MWMAFNGFPVTRVEIDLGYIEYKVMMTHRDKWQNLGAILDSTAEIQTFASELCKKMDIQYQSVPMPVDLRFSGNGTSPWKTQPNHPAGSLSVSSADAAKLMAQVHSDAEAANIESPSEVKGMKELRELFAK